jgi:preprotein translocase subunit SecB
MVGILLNILFLKCPNIFFEYLMKTISNTLQNREIYDEFLKFLNIFIECLKKTISKTLQNKEIYGYSSKKNIYFSYFDVHNG